MVTLADLPRVTQDQIARFKLRGRTAELEALKARLPEELRGLVDEVVPAVAGASSRRSVSRRISALAEKTQASQAPTSDPETKVAQAATVSDPSILQQNLDEIKAQLAFLQQTTGFKEKPSLTYGGIKNEWVRRQLVMDNTRMEHALLDTLAYPMFGEKLALRFFCAFAFLQVEEMLNYLYWCRYGDDIDRLVRDFTRQGNPPKFFKNDQNSNTMSRRKISEVQTASKLKAFNEEFCGETWTVYNDLNRIRNVEQHRCSVLLNQSSAANSYESGTITVLNNLTPRLVRDGLQQMYEQVIGDPACP